ncbi:MAG: dihydroneopterin aldolase family protein [Thermoplasmata archaeon]
MAPRSSIHRAGLSRREALLFEAGVKLGGVFHQYLGIPVSARTAAGVARTIERAVALQPFVVAVRATIDPDRGGPLGRGRFAYRYLTPEMVDVTVRLRDGSEEVEARLAHRADLRYPLMSVVRVGAPRRRRASRTAVSPRARRPARR